MTRSKWSFSRIALPVLLSCALGVVSCAPGTSNVAKVSGGGDPNSVAGGGEGKSVTEWPTGVTKYVRGKAYNGYTLYTSLTTDKVKLIDMMGNVVHQWSTGAQAGMYGELLDNGNLLYSGRTDSGYGAGDYHMSGKGGTLREITWDGKVVTEIKSPNAHHDQCKMTNGNYLQFMWEKTPEQIAKKIPGGIAGTEFKGGVIFEEVIAEFTPEGKKVWEWRASDHLSPNDCPICPLNDRLEWLHFNSIFYLPEDNPVTKEESILLSLRHTSQLIIISKKTGKVIWEYGGCKDGEWGKLGAQHDAQVIAAGLPGAGNILVFDNGMNLASVPAAGLYWGIAHSRVLEIDPKSKKVVWQYENKDKEWKFPIDRLWLFNSPYISGAQRLQNGNTLVCDGANGRLFETTKGGEIVWEFINPDHKAIFRAYRYGPEAPALKGKTLTPAAGSAAVAAPAAAAVAAPAAAAPAPETPKAAAPAAEEDEGPQMKHY